MEIDDLIFSPLPLAPVRWWAVRRKTARTRASSSRGFEGLDQIVVRSKLQPDDPIGLVSHGRQKK